MTSRIRIAAAVSVAALSAGLGATAQAEELTFWNGFTGPDRPTVEALVDQFSKDNPDTPVSMDIMPWDSLMQKLLTSLATGSGPDIVAVNFAYVPQFAQSGHVMKLTDKLTAETGLDPANWSDGLKTVLQYDGDYYASPMNYATLMMYYNKDLFEAAGLDPDSPPKTWEDWTAAIEATTKSEGRAQYGLPIPDNNTIPNWPILLWGNGADIVKDGKPALTSPEAIEALTKWSAMVAEDKISPVGLAGAEADKLFETGRAAMEITGPWMTNGYTDAGLNFDVAPIPEGPAGPVTLADSVVLMINADTVQPDAALKFLAFWNRKDTQAKLANDTGFPPTRTDMAGDAALTNPWAAKFASVVDVSRFNLAGLVNFAQINDEVFTPMIQAITLGRSDVKDAAEQADQTMETLLK